MDTPAPDETLLVTLTADLARRVRQAAAEQGLTPEALLVRAAQRSVTFYEQVSQLHHVAAVGLRLFQGKRLSSAERGLAEQFQLRSLVSHVQAQGLTVTVEHLERALRDAQEGGPLPQS